LTGNTHGTHTTGSGLTGGNHGAHHGSHLPGPADKTAGPHGSDVMNKLDPRVDSDLDGSKKVGGDRTFG
jgi:6-phosphogluconate dehydrogenase